MVLHIITSIPRPNSLLIDYISQLGTHILRRLNAAKKIKAENEQFIADNKICRPAIDQLTKEFEQLKTTIVESEKHKNDERKLVEQVFSENYHRKPTELEIYYDASLPIPFFVRLNDSVLVSLLLIIP